MDGLVPATPSYTYLTHHRRWPERMEESDDPAATPYSDLTPESRLPATHMASP